jgi:cytochrome c-type biogenesis protein CcmE
MVETVDVGAGNQQKGINGKQLKFLIGGLIVVAAIGYLIFAASGSAAYYITIGELEEQQASRRNVRVSGFVIGESIEWDARDMRLQFEIEDESGQIPVHYHGARPDMFRDGAEVVVEGKLDGAGVFEARTMLLQCPSKYEEAQ